MTFDRSQQLYNNTVIREGVKN